MLLKIGDESPTMLLLSRWSWHVYISSLVVQGQEVWIKWCKAHNRADHALTSRRRPFLLQIYELASIEGRRGGLIMGVSGIHVTIQVIVNGGGAPCALQRLWTGQLKHCVEIVQFYTLIVSRQSLHWTVCQSVRSIVNPEHMWDISS